MNVRRLKETTTAAIDSLQFGNNVCDVIITDDVTVSNFIIRISSYLKRVL